MQLHPAARVAAEQAPLAAGWAALFFGWLSTYGAGLVTLLSLIYGVSQIYFLWGPKIKAWLARRKEAA